MLARLRGHGQGSTYRSGPWASKFRRPRPSSSPTRPRGERARPSEDARALAAGRSGPAEPEDQAFKATDVRRCSPVRLAGRFDRGVRILTQNRAGTMGGIRPMRGTRCYRAALVCAFIPCARATGPTEREPPCNALMNPFPGSSKNMTERIFAPGRGAVITGGASGIGLATAKQLAGRGMNVLIADLDQAARPRGRRDSVGCQSRRRGQHGPLRRRPARGRRPGKGSRRCSSRRHRIPHEQCRDGTGRRAVRSL